MVTIRAMVIIMITSAMAMSVLAWQSDDSEGHSWRGVSNGREGVGLVVRKRILDAIAQGGINGSANLDTTSDTTNS